MKVYLDNNHATVVDEQVINIIEPFFTSHYADPTALHNHAKEVRKPLDIALEKIYAGIHARKNDQISITSGANEANDRLFTAIYLNLILTGQKNHIIISERESKTINSATLFIASQGCHLSILPVDSNGIVESAALKDMITSRTALVSVTMVDKDTGAIMPIDEISKICNEHKVLLHSDATYAVGKVPIDVQMLDLDFLTLSAETFHAPAGTGLLYTKEGNQLNGLDKQSSNTIGTIALGKAIELASDAQAFEMEDIRELRDALEEAIREIPDSLIVAPWTHRVPNTIMAGFKDIDSQMLLWELNRDHISAYHEIDKSLIESIGADKAYKHTLVGFALSRYTTQEEIEYTIKRLKRAIDTLREKIACTQETKSEK